MDKEETINAIKAQIDRGVIKCDLERIVYLCYQHKFRTFSSRLNKAEDKIMQLFNIHKDNFYQKTNNSEVVWAKRCLFYYLKRYKRKTIMHIHRTYGLSHGSISVGIQKIMDIHHTAIYYNEVVEFKKFCRELHQEKPKKVK